MCEACDILMEDRVEKTGTAFRFGRLRGQEEGISVVEMQVTVPLVGWSLCCLCGERVRLITSREIVRLTLHHEGYDTCAFCKSELTAELLCELYNRK